MTKISVNLKFEKMKTKFSTGVFTAWATLFFMILIVDSSAAWYEWSKAAREKLEWDSKEADCRIKIEFEVNYDPSVGISLDGVDVELESGLKYRFAPGSRTVCIDGTKYKDCADIVGFWESWDSEGDCIPENSELSQ
jgi:hypothetical protein